MFIPAFGSSFGDQVSSQAVEETTATLVRAFSPSEIHQLSKAGKSFDYIETTTCIDRLNEAFTPMGWSYSTSDPIWQPAAEGQTSRQIAMKGIITVHTPWGPVNKEGWGSCSVKSVADGNKMDFGDDCKTASSDALKKAATLLGIYNYGYRKGPLPASEDVRTVAEDISKAFTAKGMTAEEFKHFTGGICRKTILGIGDLNIVQAKFILSLLREETKYNILSH